MEEKNLLQIKFGSYIKLSCSMSFGLGVAMGLLMFVIALLGGNVYTNLGPIQLTGISSGVVNIFFAPILTLLTGLLFGLFSFLPFKLFLKITKGIKLRAEFE
ncbi:MAG: hypothetical protein KAS78_05995 [Candidatus Pacebacteria bacterium]|nr:hypothetical protein [Candidatus Paceibacterota bacterium]